MTEQAHPTNHTHKKPEENGLAVAAFILGIVSLTGFGALTGIPAIITGFISLKNPVNKGMGIAGLVMGCISTVLTLLAIMFFLFALLIFAVSDPSPTYMHDSHSGGLESSSHMQSI